MSRHRTIAAAIAAVVLATPLAAQGTSPDTSLRSPAPVVAPVPVATSTVAIEAAPLFAATLAGATVGVRVSASNTVLAPAPLQGNVGRNPAMMIVGGVALIVGSVIGGDSGTLMMIGGGVLGLYGLWQYLQ